MKISSTLLAFGLGVMITTNAFAQDPYADIKRQYDPEGKFTKEMADSTIAFRRTENTNLQSDVNQTKNNLATTNTQIQQRMSDVTNCEDAFYTLLGTDHNGYNAYRQRLATAEQELNALRSLSPAQQQQSAARIAALETEIRYLRGQKVVVVPDHYNRVASLSNSYIQMKKGMVPPNVMYTVGTWQKDRDCLWNIAKKPEIYNDPFAWPKIWHNNMDQIKNPDLIYPGQQLTVVKTEVTQDDKDQTGYRHRRTH